MKAKHINKLRFYRKNAGLSQTQIASLCEIDLRLYQKYEEGESLPNINTAIRLANQLNVSDLREIWS